MPSLFANAKRAGFGTVYIDAQRGGGAYQNGMDDRERRDIDRFVQFDAVPVADRDRAAADALVAALHNGRRDVVLVNKMGAHFPVADKYPADRMRYRPALPRGRTAAVTEMQLPENLVTGAESWRRYRNSYRNTLLWTVGGFFDRLFAGGVPAGTLIVYTSDHGQTLHERGDAGTTTHCSPAPAPEEGAVPLVVIGGDDAWATAARRHFDATSHYRIFPTLLAAMGYDKGAVRRLYGPGLDAPARDPLTFNARFNARLGRGPLWVAIRPKALPAPPAQDTPAATPD
jgi:lipid A ethanolaminephosphotransferase